VRFSVGYRLHFDPYHRELMRLARDRDFGAFTKMRGDFAFVMERRAWRVDKQLAGGGPMMDIGIYIVHGAIMAANGQVPVAVRAQEGPKTRPDLFDQVEESMTWSMEFPDGAVLEAASSFSREANFFRVEGPGGWFELSRNAFYYRNIAAATSRGRLHYRAPDQQALQMDDFADCILTGRPTPVSGEMARRDIRILGAIYESASTGRRVLV
jgi:glucose-fructose oxidoreductase